MLRALVLLISPRDCNIHEKAHALQRSPIRSGRPTAGNTATRLPSASLGFPIFIHALECECRRLGPVRPTDIGVHRILITACTSTPSSCEHDPAAFLDNEYSYRRCDDTITPLATGRPLGPALVYGWSVLGSLPLPDLRALDLPRLLKAALGSKGARARGGGVASETLERERERERARERESERVYPVSTSRPHTRRRRQLIR